MITYKMIFLWSTWTWNKILQFKLWKSLQEITEYSLDCSNGEQEKKNLKDLLSLKVFFFLKTNVDPPDRRQLVASVAEIIVL